MASPCSATTYRTAAETFCGFQSHRVLPWRAHRFRFGSSNLMRFRWRLAEALKSLMTGSGESSASTTVCTRLVRTYLLNRFQHGVATDLVQVIGKLVHTFPLESCAGGVPFQNRGSRHVVYWVDGAGFAAVYVAPVAGKGDRVNHGLSHQFQRSLTVAALTGMFPIWPGLAQISPSMLHPGSL